MKLKGSYTVEATVIISVSLILFGLAVSIDSFGVGIGLDILTDNVFSSSGTFTKFFTSGKTSRVK